MHDHAHPIYLVRHGETAWNVEDRLQGRLDSPLTARGLAQAQGIGRALAPILAALGNFALWASPQGRAQATLAAAAHSGRWNAGHALLDARLAEITYGQWDGMSRREIEAAHPGMLDYRLRHHWSFVPPQGESYAMVAARVVELLDAAIAEAQRQAVVIFSHGAVGRVLRGHYARLAWRQIVKLDEPQDAFYRLWRGKVERIEAA